MTATTRISGEYISYTDKTFTRTKWNMLFALMFCYFFYYCGRQNFGFAIAGIQEKLHLTATDTGLISAGMLLFYGIGQAVNGSFGDKFGARKLLALGAVLSAFLNILTSFATGFWGLMIPWCLNGYAQSLGFAPGSKLIANWWEKSERGKAFGLYLFSSGISSIVTFVICIWVLSYFDWPWIFRIPVIFLFLSGVIFYLVARDKPEDLGYQPLAEEVDKHHSIVEQAQLTTRERYYLVLTHFRFQMASLSMGCCSVARWGLIFWVPVIYLGQHWQTSSQSVWVTIALPIGMALGTLASGSISDKLFNSDRLKPTILFMLLAAVLTIALYFTPLEQTTIALILLFFVGFFVYGPQSSLFALCPDLLGTACTATGVGVMNAYAYGFSAVGEALIGYLIHYTNNYSVAFIVVAITCILSVIFAYFATE